MTQILITSSVLIVAMALARLVLRKRVSQRLIYGLWLLVALRLLIPVQFGHSKYSVTTVTQSATNQVQQAVQRPIAGPSREEVYDRLLEDYLARPPMVPEAPTAPESPTIPQTPVVPEVTTPAPTIPAQVQTQLRQEAQEQVTAPSLSQILTFIWIFGMVAMAVWFFTANLLFSRKIRRDSVLLSDCHWNDTGVPLVGAIRLLLCPHLDTPCLVGLFRPTVCLTPASIEDSDTRRHVLTHELTHLRHGDHIWSLIRCLCLCVYWFNPLVWLAAILSKRDQELACDEAALLKLGEHERIPYGRTLLNIVIRRSTPGKILQTATAMSETKKQLKERIEFIVKRPKNLWFAAISLILIAALATGCAFAGSKPTTEPTQAPTNSTTEATDSTIPTDPEPSSKHYLTESSDENIICLEIPTFDGENVLMDATSEWIVKKLEDMTGSSFHPAPSETKIETSGVDYTEFLIDLQSTVYRSGNHVTVICEGILNAYKAAHPTNLFFAINLDAQTGQRIWFRDVYDIDQDLYQTFDAEARNHYWSGDYDEFSEGMHTEKGFSWYPTGDGIVISYPVIFALGSHMEVTIPYPEATVPTEPELPADSPYASILTGYHALVAARLSGESPTQDTLRIFTDATGGNASLERTWNAMVADLTANLQNPTAQSFLHRTRDINGDGEPELLLLRRDGILLALFTTCQGQPRLLDAFHTGYRAVMTDQGQLYTLFYSAAGQYDYHIQTLGPDGQFTTDGAFGVDSPGTYHYEIQNGRECAISAERFEQLLQAHPFQWGDSWNNTGAAGYLLQRGERYEIFSLVPFSYHYRLFDREGNIIEERDTGSRYPGISMITDTILEIKIGYGTGVIAHHYLDLETDRISSTFLQVLCTNGDLIAYLDGEQLIVESIFGKTNLYKQIDHNLAPELVQVAQASFSSDGRILYFTYPISGESTTTHIYYLYEPQYVHDVPLGKWTATVCFQDETKLSYSLQLNQDGTAVYTMGYYRSELIEKMEGTWREADESFGEDAYYLELVPMVLDENTGALTYIHQSVFRLRLAEDGRLIRADLLDGLPLFQGISGTSLLMYHHESYSILYDFPIQYL